MSDNIKKDAVKKDTEKKDGVKKDAVKKANTKKSSTQKSNAKKPSGNKVATKTKKTSTQKNTGDSKSNLLDKSSIETLAKVSKIAKNPVGAATKGLQNSAKNTAKKSVSKQVKNSKILDKETQDTLKDINKYFKDLGKALKK